MRDLSAAPVTKSGSQVPGLRRRLPTLPLGIQGWQLGGGDCTGVSKTFFLIWGKKDEVGFMKQEVQSSKTGPEGATQPRGR